MGKFQWKDLKNLGKCLVNGVALARLRSGDTLELALAEVEGASLFGEALVLANAKLERTVELLPKYEGDKDLLSVAKDITTRADIISTMMDRRSAEKSKR